MGNDQKLLKPKPEILEKSRISSRIETALTHHVRAFHKINQVVYII